MGDLVERLRKRAYFMCVSCDEAPLPEERACHLAENLRLVDGEPWCEVCHGDSGAFPDVQWRDRPAFDPFTELVDAAKAESADALEAAERERDAMRKALTKIRDHPESHSSRGLCYAVGAAFSRVQNIARDALSQHGGGDDT